jgi:hypothetical protein
MQLSNSPSGVTSREIDLAQLMHDETVPCANCNTEIAHDAEGVVEVDRVTLRTQYFCNPACRMNKVWEETYSASGRADLLRTVAALHLLMESQILSSAPAVSIYDADYAHIGGGDDRVETFDFANFRRQALSFLAVLSPEGCAWAGDAQDAAGDFAGNLSAKAVASFTEISNALITPKETKVINVTA